MLSRTSVIQEGTDDLGRSNSSEPETTSSGGRRAAYGTIGHTEPKET